MMRSLLEMHNRWGVATLASIFLFIALPLSLFRVETVSAAPAQCYTVTGTNVVGYRSVACDSISVAFEMSGYTPEDDKCYMVRSGWGIAETSKQGEAPCTTWAASGEEIAGDPPICKKFAGNADDYNNMKADITQLSDISCDELKSMLEASGNITDISKPGLCYLGIQNQFAEGKWGVIFDTCWGIISHFVALEQSEQLENSKAVYNGPIAASVDTLPNPLQTQDGTIIANVIRIVLAIAGAIAVLLITISGFKYTMSMGEPTATKKAKDTILYAVIGLFVVIIANFIVGYVVSNLVP